MAGKIDIVMLLMACVLIKIIQRRTVRNFFKDLMLLQEKMVKNLPLARELDIGALAQMEEI